MLFIKRLLTALVLLAMLFMVLYVGGMAVGQHLAARRAVEELPTNFHTLSLEHAADVRARKAFQREQESTIGLAALAVAAVGAVWLSFGGMMSWCREWKPPPPLPRNMRYGGGTEPFRKIR